MEKKEKTKTKEKKTKQKVMETHLPFLCRKEQFKQWVVEVRFLLMRIPRR
jgi:hypothetical protein